MGNIIDELLTEEEKEMYDQETLKQQDMIHCKDGHCDI